MKAWTSPELTILVRTKPDEGVLIGCKTDNIDGLPILPVNNCLNETEACHDRTTS